MNTTQLDWFIWIALVRRYTFNGCDVIENVAVPTLGFEVKSCLAFQMTIGHREELISIAHCL